MRKRWVGGNWKMNGSLEDISSLVDGMITGLAGFEDAEVVVFPSFVYLPKVKGQLSGSKIFFGAQNVSQFDHGAYTGEVSASMLADIGCKFVLVGHSERRHVYGETSEVVAEKFSQALSHRLTPVLCIGETLEQREANQTEQVVLEQLNTVIGEVGVESLGRSVIAYEPVWAIGTGLTATPEQAQEVHSFIRKTIALQHEALADEIQIVYGGSVKAANAAEIFEMPDVDGGLIGGASLKANEFVKIVKS